MEKLVFDKEYFDIESTLTCGQLFRFKKAEGGYACFSLDKCALLKMQGDKTVISVDNKDAEYFYDYFDGGRDYNAVFSRAINSPFDIVKKAAEAGKGVRILKQNATETLFSFIISQNNNIPRIKGIIERLCIKLGDKKTFCGETFYSFPTAEKMAEMPESFYYSIGLGYRAPFIKRLADEIAAGFSVEKLSCGNLKENLLRIFGVGNKVADCVMLFGFNKTDAFPVDTWIEKVYRENFNGNLTDRKKISEFFTKTFGADSGFIQQYLFYYKRSIEEKISDKNS